MDQFIPYHDVETHVACPTCGQVILATIDDGGWFTSCGFGGERCEIDGDSEFTEAHATAKDNAPWFSLLREPLAEEDKNVWLDLIDIENDEQRVYLRTLAERLTAEKNVVMEIALPTVLNWYFN